MVALQRSGKSTYVERNFREIAKVSADQLRLLIHGKRVWLEREQEVWAIREILLKALLEQQLDVVIDETNLTKKSRKAILKLAKQYGYTAIAIIVNTDKEICKRRAIETDQADLVPVIERMAKSYRQPTLDEGFAEVRHIKG